MWLVNRRDADRRRAEDRAERLVLAERRAAPLDEAAVARLVAAEVSKAISNMQHPASPAVTPPTNEEPYGNNGLETDDCRTPCPDKGTDSPL